MGTKYLSPSVSGFLLAKELEFLDGAIKDGKKPLAAIVGGSKVSSKIGVLEALVDKCDKVIIGGGVVFTFLKARGLPTGSSLVEDDFVETAKKVEEVAKEKGCKIILPSDVVLADKFAPDAETKVTSASEIPDGWMGLDNGPEATKEIQAELAELTGKGACTIIGGGDSVAAVEKAGLAEKMSHVSTGGGASLELLEGKILPGVAALDEL